MQDSWTLLRLNPSTQFRFMDLAAENSPEIPLYFPVFLRTTRPAHKRTPIQIPTPVYPGYIFAQINPDSGSVHRLTSLPIRAYFIRLRRCTPRSQLSISTIPDSIIQEFKRLESLNLLVRETHRVNPFAPGTSVVVHLPIADIQAIIVHLIGQTRVLVDGPLGRMTTQIHRLTVV
jgi:hypothetical protein